MLTKQQSTFFLLVRRFSNDLLIYSICLDKNLSCDIFKNEITSLVIGIDLEKKNWTILENIFNNLLSMMKNLIDLTFYDASYENTVRLLIDVPSPKFCSSTLLRLKIKAQTFDDCLYIVDGRFDNLQSLYILLANISRSSKQIENQVSFLIRDIYIYFFQFSRERFQI
jgi:hypothetical protein